ncbi:sigma-70 family RNA polymerase sigma factor [Tuwongella immobilis]|uniref:RNA polymerase sigma-70 region 2 domain-containing protein n=1 Tax=Tuwongella immobilis TaxID=692036 RepID=A0A6C2YK00_9BACT|nr:sigma-70 family RNA polymerase sigma factor [Tuwongella immobilis]VIP01910.1 extracytoplasmic function alternative sigma factor : RNA polymerase, sigma-24 subunit, ECF subfamily OS=Pirellula staleyi (strain ATCC 27377 / DSM 6068 / ICPB 4128) GN=Psta_4560 PE=4 SV=1: Sigma70_r2 [Tuwongella immobilis]VTR99818.1 extracytoplasmic function alternative sigma factor : RNA polymerase, sigma-24 subunit, ECF subfamily OS=Pirellula staleyi (strain ATCC 27377 / DSM 6068 / ICPB 4128) GN=Psta_4560 PE=4 SV=1:
MPKTPGSLLDRLREQPNPHDWQQFVKLFSPILFRWVRRFGVAENDVEDVLQELFILLFKRLASFVVDPNKSFHAWLWTVTRNFVYDWQERTRPPLPAEFLEQLAAPDEVSAEESREFARILVERGLAIIQNDFQPNTWAVFLAVAIEKRSGAEVARQYHMTANAVYLTYSRVLYRLRTELTGFWE